MNPNMFRRNGVLDIFSKAKSFFGKFRWIRSLRVRIFLIVCVVGIVPSIFLRGILLNSYRNRAISVRISEVSNQCTILANHLMTYGYMNDQSSEVVNAELEQFSTLYNGRVMIIDNDLCVTFDTYSISRGRTMISEEVLECFRKESIAKYDEANGFIEFTTPIIDLETSKVVGVILTSVSTAYIDGTMEIMARRAHIFEIVFAIIIICLSFFLSAVLLRPFREINSAIIRIREGFTEERISVPVFLETEAISESFNQLIDKMKVLDESRQEFVSNVSHELKTPITSVKVLADSLLAMEDVPVEVYREFMVDIGAEIERENKIINDLLSLVKLDKKNSELMNVSMVDINQMLEYILKRVRPIADEKGVELIFQSNRVINAEIDEIKLSLALMNVIENAVKYNKDNGLVTVTLDGDHQFFMITIEDTGIGIPEDSIAHIYVRFYRVDKSHSREIGGTGLGLAITRNAILMHHGAIKVSSVENEGTTFTIKIPRNHIVVAEENQAPQIKTRKIKVKRIRKNSSKEKKNEKE